MGLSLVCCDMMLWMAGLLRGVTKRGSLLTMEAQGSGELCTLLSWDVWVESLWSVCGRGQSECVWGLRRLSAALLKNERSEWWQDFDLLYVLILMYTALCSLGEGSLEIKLITIMVIIIIVNGYQVQHTVLWWCVRITIIYHHSLDLCLSLLL